MGDLSRARDEVYAHQTDDVFDAALDEYARVVRRYLMTDIHCALENIHEQSGSRPAGE